VILQQTGQGDVTDETLQFIAISGVVHDLLQSQKAKNGI
jgi:hypothetical protein